MTQKRIKRIKALKRYITAWNEVTESGGIGGDLCYVLRQSDIRALAEQIIDDCAKEAGVSAETGWTPGDRAADIATLMYGFKRVGMTPGRKGGAK